LATGSGAGGDKPPVSPHVYTNSFHQTPQFFLGGLQWVANTDRAGQITFYTIYGRPIAKVFLIAMGTYQLLYFCWKKLEAVEEQKGKQGWI